MYLGQGACREVEEGVCRVCVGKMWYYHMHLPGLAVPPVSPALAISQLG